MQFLSSKKQPRVATQGGRCFGVSDTPILPHLRAIPQLKKAASDSSALGV